MNVVTANKEDAQIAALKLEMARRGWGYRELADALKVGWNYLENQFSNEFSAKAMRVRVNDFFKPRVIFTEGIGL